MSDDIEPISIEDQTPEPEPVEAAEPEGPAPIAPSDPFPQVVTMRQARLALLAIGKLAHVATAIAAIPDPMQRQAAQIEWEYSATVERNRPFVQMLAPALGLSSAQLDQLFIEAAKL